MITDRNKLNFVTIQWLWFLCLTLAAFSSTNTWIHYAEATQPHQQQQQPQQQIQQQQLKTTLQLQQQVESNGPPQQKHQQQQDVTVRNFSPRMDYNNNEWRPVGRGDPLKNDPTFDYSPPTLDRVRYWADSDKEKDKTEEVTAALVDAKLKKANPGKNEILLLGVTGDRMRGGAPAQQHHQHVPNIIKNAKGETPLLQPKYTSIRRSYYAHQLPTHLMPPPMQPMQSATQQHQLQSSQMQQHQQSSQSQPQQHQVQSMHIVKPVHTEYRHSMPGHSYMTSSPMSSMSVHSKPYYMSTATQPWMYTSSSPSMTTSSSSSSHHSPLMMSANSHRYSHPHAHAYDSHHQESVNYLSYHSRPNLTSTPSIMLGMNAGIGHHEIYSPNSIRGAFSGHKSPVTSSRKPWIHDLLQKEFIKPVKPTHNPNSYHVETIKSSHVEPQHFEPIMRPQGISTTYAPVTFVTPTMPSTTSTTQTVYITSTTQKQTISTSPSPMYDSTPPTHTTYAPRTTTTLSPTRLLIPNISNLAYRPTIAPIKMTTDALFSHYNQPDKPLRGPMYLIIEGHSKVKTYGKDELDPHKPKIVPIIPNREPVVRMADPNEKRGTPETFQVKHLHTKTTKPMETSSTTTAKPATTKATTPKASNTKATTTKAPAIKASTSKAPATTRTTTKQPAVSIKTTAQTLTTEKPKTTTKMTTAIKPIPKKVVTTSTTTTVKPTTSKPAPKLSVTTATPAKPRIEKSDNKEVKSPSKNDLKMSPKIANPNALETPKKPSQALLNEPPTGMQGLLSFLDSSLDSIFNEDTMADNSPKMDIKDTTTKLKPMPMKTANAQPQQQQIEARVSTKLEPINAEEYENYDDDNYFKMTTEYIPRETRQVFDYDQLPESRINLKDDANFGAFLEQIDDDEDDLSAFNLGDEYEEDDEEVAGQQQGQTAVHTSSNQHNLIKRIDSLVSSSVEDDLDNFSSLVDDGLTDIEEDDDLTDLARNQQRQQQQVKTA